MQCYPPILGPAVTGSRSVDKTPCSRGKQEEAYLSFIGGELIKLSETVLSVSWIQGRGGFFLKTNIAKLIAIFEANFEFSPID